MRRVKGASMVTRPQFNAGGAYELDDDIDVGFETAVRNSQTVLALQYLRLIVVRDQQELANLRAEVEQLRTAKPATATKKAIKKEESA